MAITDSGFGTKKALPKAIKKDTTNRDIIAFYKREDFAVQMLAALVANSNSRGILPNPDMMAKEAIKYTDALLLELSK